MLYGIYTIKLNYKLGIQSRTPKVSYLAALMMVT